MLLGQAAPSPEQPAAVPPAASQPAQDTGLAQAPEVERQTLERMLKDPSWPRRAIACMRLERYTCEKSRHDIEQLLHDPAWQVRAFAVRSLARRQVAAGESWFSAEDDPRVMRAALRHGYVVDVQRLERGVQTLSRSSNLKAKMLAAELGAASRNQELTKLAIEATKQIILRMNRAEAGGLSPRLAALTGQTELRRPLQWQQWLMKAGRAFELKPAMAIAEVRSPAEPSRLARLEAEQFVALEDYMVKLSEHKLDLAICLDCTASMGREIAAAQGGIDDMMLFVGDVVSSLRVALVAYRDRSDEFQTKAWEFDSDINKIREQLWQLSADGGGDHPEAVYPALRLAFTQLQWRTECSKALVIVGDAPPHVGYGGLAVNLAKRAREEAQLITHAIQARGKDVKHFPEIAQAGGGRCVALQDSDALMAEITGLTLGDRFEDEFREFFQVYLELCR